MEAAPRLPMLHFDLKVSTESVQFGPKLKPYIANFYNEDPESYSSEIQKLESLRASAAHPSMDISGVQLLKKYYCQLHFLKSRFPMEEGQVCAVQFVWKDAQGGTSSGASDIRFELMAVLYNIGVLHCYLGAADSRSNPEGMKMACTHFQCAAWAFQNIKEKYNQFVYYISSLELIHFYQQVCLAQAQECILEKSMLDNRKPNIIAKVAVQVYDYYRQSLVILQSTNDDVCGSKNYKEFIKYLQFKIAYHRCVSLLFEGQQAEEQQKMGERVAFYQAACENLEEARKLASGFKNDQKEIIEALAFTLDVVEGKRKAAKNENEFIYHEEVPDITHLEEVKGASLVKGIPFNVTDTEVSGPDIFSRLVPMAAHEAASLYSEKKAQMLREVGEMVEIKDQALAEFMSSMQLDILTKMHQATGIPQEVIDRAASLSAKPNATQDLVEAMGRLSNIYQEVESSLNEIDALLKEEEESEKYYQEVMGKRPLSIIATDLTREAAKYREAHSKANDSNQTLHKAMMTHVANLKILQQPLKQLQQQLPTVEMPNPNIDDASLKELEMLSSKVDEMRSQRAMLWAQLRDSVHRDDITSALVTKPPNQSLDHLFVKELEKHEELVGVIKQNISAQDNIKKAFVDAYAKAINTRRYVQDVIQKRTTTIQALIASYDAYEDLLAKASKGIEFYTKLETNVSKLLQRIRSACKVQQEERDQMLSKNNFVKKVADDEVAPLPASSVAAPKLKDYLDARKKTPVIKYPDSAAQYPTMNYGAISQNLPDTQTWPPGIRPAPVGSEVNSDPAASASKGAETAYNYPYNYNQPASFPSNQNNDSYTNIAPYSNANTGYFQSPQIYNNSPSPVPPVQSYSTSIPSSQNYANSSIAQNQNYSGTPQLSGDIALNAGTNTMHPNYGSSYAVPQNYSNVPSIAVTPNYNTSFSAGQGYVSNVDDLTGRMSALLNKPHSPVADPQYNPQQYSYSSYVPQNYSSTAYSNSTQVFTDTSQSVPSSSKAYTSTTNSFQPISSFLPGNSVNTNMQYPDSSLNTSNSNHSQQASGLNAKDAYSQYGATTANYSTSYPQDNVYSGQNTSYAQDSGGASYVHQCTPVVSSYSQHGNQYYPQGYAPNYTSPLQDPLNSSTIEQKYHLQEYATSVTPDLPTYGYSTYSSPVAPLTNTNIGSTLYADSTSGAQGGATANVPSSQASSYNTYYMNLSSQPSSVYNNANYDPSKAYYTSASNESYPVATQSYYYPSSTQQQNTTAPIQQQEVTVPTTRESNIDLLSGLDFSVNQAPLIPQQNVTLKSSVTDVKSNHSIEGTKSSSTIEVRDESKPIAKTKSEVQILPSKALGNNEVRLLFNQEIEKYEKYIESLPNKTLSGPTNLDLKWKEIHDKQELDCQKKSISVARCYPAKNKFPDILPYDYSRVELRDAGDDYINASYVKNISPCSPQFIVTQAPLLSTFGDFWAMIKEQQVELIFCLLNDNEIGNDVYWPAEKGQTLQIRNMVLTLQSVITKPNWIERLISLSIPEKRESLVVMHVQFTSWPGSLFPTSPEPFLSYVLEVINLFHQQRCLTHPVVVHCSSGIGRSGLICLLVTAILDVTNNSNVIPDLAQLTSKLTNCRKNILRDREHLKFAYECFLCYMKQVVAQDKLKKKLNELVAKQEEPIKDQSNNIEIKEEKNVDPLSSLDPFWASKK